MFNLDFNQSSKTVHHSRFIFDRLRTIDNAATFPEFFASVPQDGRLFSYTLIHNFTPKLTNETRLAYRRYVQTFPVPDITYPGLDQFPNIDLDDLGLSVGPDSNAPQFTIENSYQIVDQVTYNFGRHSLKFGVDWRNIISPTSLADMQARSNILPQYLAAGFTSPIAAFLANDNSTYHAGSASLTRRLSDGLQFTAAYTWSHRSTTQRKFSVLCLLRGEYRIFRTRPRKKLTPLWITGSDLHFLRSAICRFSGTARITSRTLFLVA